MTSTPQTSSPKFFGTDGIRQPADQFTTEFLTKIIAGLAAYAGTDKKVLIGGDTRESSEWILQDLAQALETFGFEYGSVGVLPTPAINYCFYAMGFDFAIDVTASHNPYTDNGIKIFERGPDSGIKLTAPGVKAIESALASSQVPTELVAVSDREDLHDEAVQLYLDHLYQYLGPTDLSGLNIGLDCADGATSVIATTPFDEFHATIHPIHADPSYGQSINHACGSTHLDELQALVTEHGLDFGIAYDGDGDRCLLVDHEGSIVDGDQIIAILADHLQLDAIAITVMANQGLINWASDHHIRTEITSVGDSNVATAMRELHIPLGGEQSGHIILPGQPTGDGILTSLMLAKVIAETGKSLGDLVSLFTKLPQVSITIPATPEQKSSLHQNEAIKSIILQFNEKVNTLGGRLLVRPSGTEPLIRITLWGPDETTIADLAHELGQTLTVNL